MDLGNKEAFEEWLADQRLRNMSTYSSTDSLTSDNKYNTNCSILKPKIGYGGSSGRQGGIYKSKARARRCTRAGSWPTLLPALESTIEVGGLLPKTIPVYQNTEHLPDSTKVVPDWGMATSSEHQDNKPFSKYPLNCTEEARQAAALDQPEYDVSRACATGPQSGLHQNENNFVLPGLNIYWNEDQLQQTRQELPSMAEPGAVDVGNDAGANADEVKESAMFTHLEFPPKMNLQDMMSPDTTIGEHYEEPMSLIPDSIGRASKKLSPLAYTPGLKPIDPQISVQQLSRDRLLWLLEDGLLKVGQLACRGLASQWVRVISPHKRILSPYRDGDTTKPCWWPKQVPHIQPSKLKKCERIQLLMAIILGFPHLLTWFRLDLLKVTCVDPYYLELLDMRMKLVQRWLAERSPSLDFDKEHRSPVWCTAAPGFLSPKYMNMNQ